jgi:hypothetical protein
MHISGLDGTDVDFVILVLSWLDILGVVAGKVAGKAGKAAVAGIVLHSSPSILHSLI